MHSTFVVSGPSGAGKTTVVQRVREACGWLHAPVSCTTRAKGVGEVDGVHYHFISRDTFEQWIEEGRFLEWADVFGNLYGTLWAEVHEASGCIILEIDVQGALQVLSRFPAGQVKAIFIRPPSVEVMEERIRSRKRGESEEAIRTRLCCARDELEIGSQFEFQITNIELEATVAEVMRFIEGCRAYV